MAGPGKRKLSDAIARLRSERNGAKGGKRAPAHETTAEQVREAGEMAEAKNAEGSIRERMVRIGRGNQQAGRHSG